MFTESLRCRECGSQDVAEYKPGAYVCTTCDAQFQGVLQGGEDPAIGAHLGIATANECEKPTGKGVLSNERPADTHEPASPVSRSRLKKIATGTTKLVPTAIVGAKVVEGALESTGLTKKDRKTGKRKLSKWGVAKAVVRPTKTVRRAVQGADLREAFKLATDPFLQDGSPPGSDK